MTQVTNVTTVQQFNPTPETPNTPAANPAALAPMNQQGVMSEEEELLWQRIAKSIEGQKGGQASALLSLFNLRRPDLVLVTNDGVRIPYSSVALARHAPKFAFSKEQVSHEKPKEVVLDITSSEWGQIKELWEGKRLAEFDFDVKNLDSVRPLMRAARFFGKTEILQQVVQTFSQQMETKSFSRLSFEEARNLLKILGEFPLEGKVDTSVRHQAVLSAVLGVKDLSPHSKVKDGVLNLHICAEGEKRLEAVAKIAELARMADLKVEIKFYWYGTEFFHGRMDRFCELLKSENGEVIEKLKFGGRSTATLDEVITLVNALKSNSGLKIVEFTSQDETRGNRVVTDRGAQRLAEGLRGNKTLERLALSDTHLGDKGAEALGEGLKGNIGLKELSLSTNSIGGKGAEALAEGLKANTSLRCLGLVRNSVGLKGVTALADALTCNSTLEKLSLGKNHVTFLGAQALGYALGLNKGLKSLELEHNSIGDDGSKFLAAGLASNTTLEALFLQHNSITRNGAKALADRLRRNRFLRKLGLGSNSICDPGAEDLANALKDNSTLLELDLGYNFITNKGIQALAEGAGSRRCALKVLSVYSNPYGRKGRNALARLHDLSPPVTVHG